MPTKEECEAMITADMVAVMVKAVEPFRRNYWADMDPFTQGDIASDDIEDALRAALASAIPLLPLRPPGAAEGP